MSEPGVSFSVEALSRLTMRLQSLCAGCALRSACPKASCPIALSRNLIGDYLIDKRQVLQAASVDSLPRRPAGVTVSEPELVAILGAVHDLCKMCMFHTERCFLNVLYAQIERMLGRAALKSPNKRPGEA